jgi:glutamyl-tRNA reductase
VPLVVVGINERDTPLELLGNIAVSDRDLAKVLKRLCDSSNLDEAVVLSTCMRTEIYAVVERFHDGVADIHEIFNERAGGARLDDGTLAEHLVVEYDDAAARHLFEVASGIDSAVLGEGEILRQVRHASSRAREEQSIGPVLDGLFRHAVEVGKRARTETAIARGITSLAYVATAIASQATGGSLAGKKIIVVGAGEMGEGIADALGSSGTGPAEEAPREIVFANRSMAKAETLAGRVGGRAIGLKDLFDEVAKADVIMTATSGDEVVFDLASVTEALASRRRQPLIIVDAAMPRDVEPEVSQVEGVTLFNLDDLRRFAEAEVQARRAEVARVIEIIDDELERYRVNARTRTVAPVVSALRTKADQILRQELEHFGSRLDQLGAEDRELVETLAHRLVQKLLHDPTVHLKEAAGSSRGERLAEAMRSLFDL